MTLTFFLTCAALRLREPGYYLHDTWVPDAHMWLEDDTSADVQAWATARDAEAHAELANSPAIEARMLELSDVDEVSLPMQRGNRTFFTRTRRGESKMRIIFVEGGVETEVVDTNQVEGKVSMVQPSWDGRKLVYKRHPKDADAAELVLLSLDPVRVLAEMPGAQYAYPTWNADSTGLFYTFLPPLPEGMNESDHAGMQTVVSCNLEGEQTVVVPPKNDSRKILYPSATRDGRFLWMLHWDEWTSTRIEVMPLPDGKWRTLIDTDGRAFMHHTAETFFVLQIGGPAPRGQVLAIPDGGGEATVLVAQRSDVLDGCTVLGQHLVLTLLADLRPYVEIRSLDGKLVRTFGLPEDRGSFLPTERGRGLGHISRFSGDPEQAVAYFSVEAPLQPPAVLSLTLPDGAISLFSHEDVPFTPNAVVEQLFVTDSGARIPIVVVRPNGSDVVPTILHGYGGFGLIEYPRFRREAIAWVETGGAFAVAVLRGGGEYGQAWHLAGCGQHKQRVFDDFAAAARELVRAGVTQPSLLIADGRSNGGLLVGAAVTQHPELFGAALSHVPLLDMVRFTRFDQGSLWTSEYGDPANATDFPNLLRYSPYHHVQAKANRSYPALLLMSAADDDRVSPMHARKFLARLRELGHDNAWLRLHSGGHHGGTRDARAKTTAEALAFAQKHAKKELALRSFGSAVDVSPCELKQHAEAAVQFLLAAQRADGLFRYELDFAFPTSPRQQVHWAEGDEYGNVVRQAGTALFLADAAALVPEAREASHRAVQELWRQSVGFRGAKLVSLGPDPQGSAKAGATALALAAALSLEEEDERLAEGLAELRQGWLAGLVALRAALVENRTAAGRSPGPGEASWVAGFAQRPSVLEWSAPCYNGEAWYAVARYRARHPDEADALGATEAWLAEVEGEIMAAYGGELNEVFFHWGLQAAALRGHLEFLESQVERVLKTDAAPVAFRDTATSWNRCGEAEGLAPAISALERAGKDTSEARARLAEDLHYSFTLQVPGPSGCSNTWAAAVDASVAKEAAGGVRESAHSTVLRIDDAGHCARALALTAPLQEPEHTRFAFVRKGGLV